MSDTSLPYTLTAGAAENVNQLMDNLNRLKDAVNLDVDSGLAEPAGLSVTGTVRRGKAIVATEEARTNTAYGLLATPDRVSNVVMPTDGLIIVGYQALVKSSVADAGEVALFIGANQLTVQDGTGRATATQAAPATTTYNPVSTCPVGLAANRQATGDFAADVTTGQAIGWLSTDARAVIGGSSRQLFNAATNSVLGGLCPVFAAAGTYDISVQFKASSGSVTAKGRKLWVWTMGF